MSPTMVKLGQPPRGISPGSAPLAPPLASPVAPLAPGAAPGKPTATTPELRAPTHRPVATTPASAGKTAPLDPQLGWATATLATTAELTDGELSSLRSQIRTLDLGALQQLRRTLERTLPAWRTKRAPQALKGPATVDKVMELMGGPGRLGRLPRATKDELRAVRESNVDALLSRAALAIVNGNAGEFHRHNAGDAHHPEGFPVTFGGQVLDHIDQRYALVERVSGLLRVGYSEAEITGHIDRYAAEGIAAAQPPPTTPHARAQAGMAEILERSALRAGKRAKAFEAMPTPPGMDEASKAKVAHRLSQVRWIEARTAAAEPKWSADAPVDYKEDLKQVLTACHSSDQVLERIDARFEAVMDYAIAARLRADGLDPLPSVRVERLPAERVTSTPDTSAQRLGPKHEVRQRLAEIARRLGDGERSAVGTAYATQTFPIEVLADVAAGDLKVVAFDGSRDNGVRYIRDTYGVSESGVRSSARLMGLQGVYGSYPRTLVTLDDGQQFLLLSGYGGSRQLNNAATLLLYTTPEGARASLDKIDLATDGTDFTATVKQDLLDAIAHDWAASKRSGAPDGVPTRLMILQNPSHLEQLLGDDLRWGTPPETSLMPFLMAYRTHEDGHEERIIIPKVGGGGLYGDTAGQFIEAFYATGLEGLVPDVIFNGAAGGFAGTAGTVGFDTRRGLPAVEPGGVFMPTEKVEQYGDGRGPLKIPGLLDADPNKWPAAVRAAREASGVHTTSQHVAISAPAIETFPLIHDLVAQGHASIDVEAGAIMDAARKLGKTCTVVYTHSDDPRASEAAPNTALGMVAPFLEGSRYHAPLFEFIKAVWDYSAAKAS